MSMQSDYMLGRCFALLVQARGHMIRNEDALGIELIEDEYQSLKENMAEHYYSHLKGKKDE
jgi:hypothetical protein